MLAYNFDYYLPETIKEAVDIFNFIQKEGKTPLYYGGGTEIISMARVNTIKPDAVIDIKKIPDCRGIITDGTMISFGAASTLNEIKESNLYPLLGLAAGRIADHTIQCKLTLGGNLAGTIKYHETLLPLLLADATISLSGPSGSRYIPIGDVLNKNKGLTPGELIVRVDLEKQFTSLPYYHIKKSKIEKIGYPLVTLCAIYFNGLMGLAASGLCSYPFRFRNINIKTARSASELAGQLAATIPQPILDDIGGSSGYRLFEFKKTAENIIVNLKRS